jgi:hypothetical protein
VPARLNENPIGTAAPLMMSSANNVGNAVAPVSGVNVPDSGAKQ